MTYKELIPYGINELSKASIMDAATDTYILIDEIFGVDRGYLLAHGDSIAEDEKVDIYREYISRRSQRIPLQHILGVQNFMGLRFNVNEHVLIPRFDTEILVEEALKELHAGMNILDMCTGSGCILISLLKYSNECMGTGIDISRKALEVAQKNAEEILSDKEDTSCVFIESDLFSNEKLKGETFDLIVSNPPYIETSVIDTLEIEVKEHDPIMALDGGEDGLYFYRRIIKESVYYLKKGAPLIFEIGYNQGEEVSKLMADSGYKNINIIKDYAGLDRVVVGRRAII